MGRNIRYYFKKKKVHFHILDVSCVLYAKKLPSTQKKGKTFLYHIPNIFPRKICLPSNAKYRATTSSRIIEFQASVSLSLSSPKPRTTSLLHRITRFETTDSCNDHRPPLINEPNIKFHLSETCPFREYCHESTEKVKKFSRFVSRNVATWIGLL